MRHISVLLVANRRAVYDNHALINAAAADGEEIESFEEWSASGGKITGYDFNLYILWGMTKSDWLATMKHTTDLRLKGNKAPIHYGAHTDYYTPIYDNATLQNDQNKSSYGLNVTKGWNTWKDRITSMEEWVDWGVKNGVHFVTGKRLIEEIKAMQAGEKVGKPGMIEGASWKFCENEKVGSTTNKAEVTGDITDAIISVKAANGSEFPDPRYSLYKEAGYFDGLTHISLNYKTTTPLQLRLMLSNGEWREVTLGSLKNSVNSGTIPMSAFQFNQYSGKKATDQIKTADIVGIEIKLVTSGKASTEEMLTVKDLVLYGAKGAGPVGIANGANTRMGALGIRSISTSEISLNIPQAGNYSVSMVGVNGRVVSSLQNVSMQSGVNKFALDNLSSGMYIVHVKGIGGSSTLKAIVR